ncbi:MAG: histidinol-phosphate aminotransferase family protein [Saprospiraceae bacterium]|nr:histidinol-phosphate aminotransferase family protein [Saprospiraceae bacterium]
MQNINRREWLRNAGLTAGAIALWNNPLKSLNHIGQYDNGTFTDDYTAQIIRLSSNENPYGPSEYVRKKISENFDSICRYPGSEIAALTQKLATKEGVTSEHILVTIGSTEGLKISALAYLQNGSELVTADPTFEAMPRYAEACGAYVHKVPVDDKMCIDLAAMEKRCNSNTKMVFICNPNNPTGTILKSSEMEQFCSRMAMRTMVFSDEAYYDYIEEKAYPSMINLVKQDLNVIVSRTFSKVYGIAGLRIGYLIARPDIITRIKAFQIDRPNCMALTAASSAMDELSFYDYSLKQNREAKKMICQTLDNLGLKYTESHANFIFFKTGMDIQKFQVKMKEQNIQVGRGFPPFNDWCRVSTGKIEDMLILQNVLKSVLS